MTRRDDVLAALRAAEDEPVSGEALAVQFGVSRVAVAKHVAALREQGYEIEARGGKGYRLRAAPDLALPAEVARALRDTIWTRVEGGLVTASTNDDARALAREGAQEGTLVVAAHQTAGRGRLGRYWDSPEGGAYLSAVLRPPMSPADVGSLALVVALGVARGLDSLGAPPRVKWPNDVLLGEGKAAGVLLEMSAEADRVDFVIAGIGINARRGTAARTATVASDGRTYPASHVCDICSARVAEVAAAALDGLAAAYRTWLEAGFAALRAEYQARMAMKGDEVEVRDLTGRVRAHGALRGVDDDGRLIVAAEDGSLAFVSAGEVTLRRP